MKIEPITEKEFHVANINKIKKIAEADRSKSKAPTFSMGYLGTEQTLIKRSGFTPEDATRVYNAFHTLYSQYFEWMKQKLSEAGRNGYVLLANGVRLDTPALAKSIVGSKVTPNIVEAEYRSVGNALSQSYGSLNTRAARKFQQRVNNSKWVNQIFVINLIHDSIYILAPKTSEAVYWININLIECMTDVSDYPELQHDIVKLEAELDILKSWAEVTTISNDTSIEKIEEIINE